jgi:hypothetical protein
MDYEKGTNHHTRQARFQYKCAVADLSETFSRNRSVIAAYEANLKELMARHPQAEHFAISS